MGTRNDSYAVAWTSALGTLYPLSGSTLDREAVASVMDRASGLSGEFFVFTVGKRLDPRVSQHLLERDLLELFIDAKEIVVGAYDGEGYVRWSRGDR